MAYNHIYLEQEEAASPLWCNGKIHLTRPLAGYGLPPPPGGILKTIFFLKPNVLQGFCNMLALL